MRAVYSDFTDASLDLLLERNKVVSLYVQCLRTFMVEVFKSLCTFEGIVIRYRNTETSRNTSYDVSMSFTRVKHGWRKILVHQSGCLTMPSIFFYEFSRKLEKIDVMPKIVSFLQTWLWRLCATQGKAK